MSKDKKQSMGLGKGLGALLQAEVDFTDNGLKIRPADDVDVNSRNFAMIDVDKITQNPYQPRKDFNEDALEELKSSIIEHGVMTAITVRRTINGWELISGERRVRAAKLAGVKSVPAFIMDVESDAEIIELALIENLQREDLNSIEIASAYQKLIEECQLTQEQVAVKVGKDRTTVTNFLRLLKLPESVQESLRNKEIMMGHARALLAINDSSLLLKVWKEVYEKNLTVRATELLVREIENGNNPLEKKVQTKVTKTNDKPNVSQKTAIILDDHENRLRHIYGTQVKINPKNEESGQIEFSFFTKDEYERLIDIFFTMNEK